MPLSLQVSPNKIKNIQQLAVNQARETIRNRIDAFGVAEPVIHEEGLGSNRIVVQLPGVDDPDRVKTIPAGVMGQSTDIAGTVAFLASDDGRFVSGQMIAVNGGETT